MTESTSVWLLLLFLIMYTHLGVVVGIGRVELKRRKQWSCPIKVEAHVGRGQVEVEDIHCDEMKFTALGETRLDTCCSVDDQG